MKAQSVNENIGFERGQDPKVAMGIGSKMARLSDKVLMDFSELRFIKNRLEVFYHNGLDKETFIFHLGELLEFPEEFNISSDDSLYQDIQWAYDNPDDSWELINLSDDEIYIDESVNFNNVRAQFVKENIGFEREQDPKVALGIGFKPEINEVIKKLYAMYDEALGRIDEPHYQGVEQALDYAIELIKKLSIMKDEYS